MGRVARLGLAQGKLKSACRPPQQHQEARSISISCDLFFDPKRYGTQIPRGGRRRAISSMDTHVMWLTGPQSILSHPGRCQPPPSSTRRGASWRGRGIACTGMDGCRSSRRLRLRIVLMMTRRGSRSCWVRTFAAYYVWVFMDRRRRLIDVRGRLQLTLAQTSTTPTASTATACSGGAGSCSRGRPPRWRYYGACGSTRWHGMSWYG